MSSNGLDTAVGDSDTLVILPAMAGGAERATRSQVNSRSVDLDDLAALTEPDPGGAS